MKYSVEQRRSCTSGNWGTLRRSAYLSILLLRLSQDSLGQVPPKQLGSLIHFFGIARRHKLEVLSGQDEVSAAVLDMIASNVNSRLRPFRDRFLWVVGVDM